MSPCLFIFCLCQFVCLSINTQSLSECLLETKTISIITLLIIWTSKECYFSWANPSTNLILRVRVGRAQLTSAPIPVPRVRRTRFQPVPEPFLVPRVRLSDTQLVSAILKVRSIGVYSVLKLVPLHRVRLTKTQEVRWWFINFAQWQTHLMLWCIRTAVPVYQVFTSESDRKQDMQAAKGSGRGGWLGYFQGVGGS